MDLGQLENKKLLDSKSKKNAKPMGRPSFKDAGTNYVRLSLDVPEDLFFEIKSALVKRRHEYKTQSEFVIDAIVNFLKK